MRRSVDRPPDFHIPPLIKRNTAFFALSLAFAGIGVNFAYALGPLMVVALTGSASLAGLAVGLLGISRFLVAYPAGKISDKYGRKVGVLLGLALGLAGTILVGLSMGWRSFPVLVGALFIFALGMDATQQIRVGATDMFPSHHRAQALGYAALGSVGGVLLSPVMVVVAESVARGDAERALTLPWLWLPILIVAGMVLIQLVHPDPRDIGRNLKHYYPDYVPSAEPLVGHDSAFSISRLLRDPPSRLAIASNCAGIANMQIVMVLMSLVLFHHGHSLSWIAFSNMLHALGMFAFTIPLGKLADDFGREKVMHPGVATALVGAVLVTFTDGYWWITLGVFLVGLGWAAANVAATALVADRVATAHRGRAIGVSESLGGAVSVLMALVTGPLIEYSGLPAAGMLAVVVSLVPLPVLIANRLGQRSARRRAAAATDTRSTR